MAIAKVRDPFVQAVLMLIGLAGLRVFIGVWLVPDSLVAVVHFLVDAIFLGVPLIAITIAARHEWSPKLAIGSVLVGMFIQFGLPTAAGAVFGRGVIGPLMPLAQIGLPIWTAGLGACVATLIREKNILIPIAIFLAMYDVFLVFAPIGFTRKLMAVAPQLLPKIGAQIPQVSTRSTGTHLPPAAFAGPADFVFLAMFMIALYRFGLKGRETARVVVPVLIAYMLIVEAAHLALPALVPIGLCVLFVNFREFKLSKEEKQSTIGLAVVGAFVLGWMFVKFRHRSEQEPPSALSRSMDDPGNRKAPPRPEIKL